MGGIVKVVWFDVPYHLPYLNMYTPESAVLRGKPQGCDLISSKNEDNCVFMYTVQ